MPKEIDLVDFAIRVEKICDFILNYLPNTPSNLKHIKNIQDLKNDAANISFGVTKVTSTGVK